MKRSKLINICSSVILLSFMLVFALSIVNEHKSDHIGYFVTFIMIIISFAALRVSDGIDDEINLLRRNYLDIVAVIVGALSTYALSISLKFGPVLAASFLALVANLILSKSKKIELSLPFYCGTFIGMSSSLILQSYFQVIVASLILGFILIICGNSFKGIGGKLGTIAFVGVATTVFIIRFLN